MEEGMKQRMIMRRTALIVSLIAAAFVAALGIAIPAHAVEDPVSIPFGQMASPSTAPAGAPMWVKSITPCPDVPDGWWGYVAVSILDQEQPASTTTLAAVDADLFTDGSWRATISAPSSAPAGATASYFVAARCVITNIFPDPNKPTDRTTIPTQGYFPKPLRVTSAGPGSFTGTGPPPIPGTATTTTTTTSTTTTSTTSTTSTTVAAGGLSGASAGGSGLSIAGAGGSTWQPKLDSDAASGAVSLDALPASETHRDDTGGGSSTSALLVFVALLGGLAAGGWQLSRFTKR